MRRWSARSCLDPNIDLANYDPILATLSSVPADAAAGANAIKSATEIQDTIAQGAAVLVGAGATPDGRLALAIAQAIAASIGSIDLTSAVYVKPIINDAATSLSLTLDTAVVQGAADVIAASNTYADALSSSDTALLTTLAQVGLIADQAATTLQTATSGIIAGIVDA